MSKKILISIPIFILAILSPVAPIFYFGLNTKKIDANIQRLLKYSWFDELYSTDKFRHLFFANKHVRKKLSSDIYVKLLSHHKKTQEKFYRFLEKEDNRSN